MPALTTHSITRRDWWILLLILLVAAVLRFGDAGIMEFDHDEAMVSILAQDMADGKTFRTTGILASVGIPNPPTSIYVMWLPYLFSSDPLLATLYVAVLNVLGVGLLWLLAHRYWGRTVGLIAGFAYALNPWALLYSRKIWAQDYHTPFVLLALFLGLYGFGEAFTEGNTNKRRWWGQVLCLPVLLFALQIHFAAWVLLPIYVGLLWMGRKRLSWKALLVTGALSTLVLLPYMIGLFETLQQDPNRIGDVIGRSGLAQKEDTSAFSIDPVIYTARFATGLGLETWVAPKQQADLLATIPPPTLLWFVIGLAVLVGLIGIGRSHRGLVGLMIAWVGLPILAFTPTWTRVYPHYFIASLPALALLAGIGVAWVVNRLPNKSPLKLLALVGFGIILLTQGFWWRGLLHYVDTTFTPNGFSTPLHYMLDVRDELAQHDDVIIISDGMWVLYDREPARWSVMLRDSTQCVRTLEGGNYAVFPDGEFAVAIAPNAPPHALGDFYVTDEPVVFPIRPENSAYSIHTFEAAPEWKGPEIIPIAPVLFDNGVQITGYHLETERLFLEWALPEAKPGLDYQYSAHFISGMGDKLSQRDTSFWPGQHWCAGDRLVTWTDITLPQDTVILRVSMYRLGTGQTKNVYYNANILDEQGNPAGQWVDIPLKES
jgi:hypothetical protein